MKPLLAVMALLMAGCNTPRQPHQSAQGYGAATTITDADGNVTTITPPTPAEEATAVWVRYGAIMAIVGIVTMLPIFGGNIRTGAVIALGGVGMAAVGKAVGDMTLSVPAWLLPALAILVAVGMLWGWHVREGQRS
jgi:hypothetical protein